MHKDKRTFLDLSAELTGYSALDLQGTGLLDTYWKLVEKQIGATVMDQLYTVARKVLSNNDVVERSRVMQIDIVTSPILWPLCRSIVVLWYRGQYNSMSMLWYKYYAKIEPPPNLTHSIIPSAQAYTEQLAYRGAGAHPPGAHPTGYGSWALDPMFGDFVNEDKSLS